MTFEEKQIWVEALLACPTMGGRKTRDEIVSHLPSEIKIRIPRHDTDNIDVLRILDQVLMFDNGINQLVNRVSFFEGDSIPMQAVRQLYARAYGKSANIVDNDSVSEIGHNAVNDLIITKPTHKVSSLTPVQKENSQTIQPNPNDLNKYYNRGNVYRHMGKYEQAIEEYNRVIELDSEYTNAYFFRGIIHWNLGKYEQALEDYDRVIQINPKHAVAYNNRGDSYLKLGQYEQAIENYEQAIQLDPEFAHAYNNQGSSKQV